MDSIIKEKDYVLEAEKLFGTLGYSVEALENGNVDGEDVIRLSKYSENSYGIKLSEIIEFNFDRHSVYPYSLCDGFWSSKRLTTDELIACYRMVGELGWI